jgi:hypothetical protein
MNIKYLIDIYLIFFCAKVYLTKTLEDSLNMEEELVYLSQRIKPFKEDQPDLIEVIQVDQDDVEVVLDDAIFQAIETPDRSSKDKDSTVAHHKYFENSFWNFLKYFT